MDAVDDELTAEHAAGVARWTLRSGSTIRQPVRGRRRSGALAIAAECGLDPHREAAERRGRLATTELVLGGASGDEARSRAHEVQRMPVREARQGHVRRRQVLARVAFTVGGGDDLSTGIGSSDTAAAVDGSLVAVVVPSVAPGPRPPDGVPVTGRTWVFT